MKRFLLLIFFFSITAAKAQGTLTLQDKPFIYDRALDKDLWQILVAEKGFSDLGKNEQLTFYWTNYFRNDPTRFFNRVIKEFITQFPEANTSEIGTLERDIKNTKAFLPVLLPDNGLMKMAEVHATDLVRRGSIISHTSSVGKGFVQRIRDAGLYKCGAENIYVGAYDPLEALIALLVDYGVPDKGHRMNLLDSRFGKMGISFPSTTQMRGLLVQDFACQ
ncbi:MAG: CAP domain-containing protein [Lacibacter sp.]